ncbi:mechanosensitive ion channel family protein [Campylobacter sp. VicNov18]|uniref:mechanosensitive ion channel family protein n=1 Tax=Campylobacter bilis TaxID=2691918 RepID=UPI00130DB2DB|nr:mechanosensitive ion channel domain-containing protein [Campylobacter bilis]MPV63833.1 mechanosensitive ion channel [Campylobacter hepaticus]MBM0637334.1 mechanosensitive ion channel [Campylobacter bilis]MCC8278053.1 mechanosensitive ion channel family protein [Campylobacter bilis]MCC8299557.1 mechanosensitive ion channel family protein [Campylobacter bilis]MCC8300962.1 mechanosensitive ion channel family protein [Campylobacter bilis]
MKKIIVLIFFVLGAWGDANVSIVNNVNERIKTLDTAISASIWNIRYENFIKYQDIKDELALLNLDLKKSSNTYEQEELKRKIINLEEQLSLLKEYKDLNFAQSFNTPNSIETLPKLTNPLAIIGAFSHIKKLKEKKEEYAFKFNDFKNLVDKIREKNLELKELAELRPNPKNIKALKISDKKLEEFEQALNFASVSYSVYEKKIDEELVRVGIEIKVQSLRAVNILIAIIIVIAIAFILKFLAKKYIKDNEGYYTATKIINFININIIFLILLFAYIENITYLVTILGFASAGLAIAMKDMFMSMLGWCVIVFGGSFRVGDRVKVFQNDTTYVGDIIDISFLRITLYEELTLETYSKNRRSGRIIFIPNNFVFTNLLANYTHHGMKTVLDGIDISITFDSNLDKAQEIVENIITRHAKGYTELARKSMIRLQNEYNIKNPKVEPRFFMFFEHWGMRISAWYMTNAYAALALRSTISKEIIKEFNKHEDIKIAYPAQNLYLRKTHDFKENSYFHTKDKN